MKQNYDRDKLWEFPCDICFKVMATNRDGIHLEVLEVVQRHAKHEQEPSSQLSRNGNYVSLSFDIQVDSKEQVDALYKDVFTVDGVKMTL
ncbi:MAG: DUF493 domain-containing protein [Gammaproteobacteria bacterium]|nr:DUF493 domain-containing protein [Gammaproteobacteria bacterium]